MTAANKGVTLHKHNNPQGTAKGKTIYVPWEIARYIPEGTRFHCELTEEGILFKRISPAAEVSWAVDPNGTIPPESPEADGPTRMAHGE